MVLSCRLCLTEDSGEGLKNVFQCDVKHAEDSLVDVLFWVFSVEIDVTDSFSKDICTECIQLVEYILQVKNTFQKNQEKLKNYFQNQNCDVLGVQALDDDGIEKVMYNGQKPSSSSYSTPTNSPSKSRYNNVYGSCSPRVRVSLSTMEAMCPMNLNLVQLENTQEYLRYKQLRNGSFKKRKYRHFNLDGALLDDICSTLEDKKYTKTEPLKREIGVSTEYSCLSKTTNTDRNFLCTCNKYKASPLNDPIINAPARDLISADRTRKENDDLLDIIDFTKNVVTTLSSPEGDREYDWTTLTFRKDASTNTESSSPTTRDIGVNARVHTATTGTLTKVFKQMKKKNVVRVNIDSLESFGPKVVLEPLEDILEEENYKQINEFSYIKRDGSLSESGTEENLEQNVVDSDLDVGQRETNKKQKFLDYYNNFRPFAVRELIAGKKIRDGDSESSPVFKVSNVCSVFVCNFCSKSFLSKISLNLHYRTAHKSGNESDDVIEVIDLVDSDTPRKALPKKIRRRRRKACGMPASKKVKRVEKDKVKNGNCTTQANTTTKHTKDLECNSENESSNKNGESKSTSLRKKPQRVNYNINDIILKAKLKVKGKRRQKRIFKPSGNLALDIGVTKNISYVWDRKSLGTYSAISYYRNNAGDDNAPLLDLAPCDIPHKVVSLKDTIQKLADRLDSGTNKNECDQVNVNAYV